MPRYQPSETHLIDDTAFRIVDAASFLSAYDQIFEREIYAFQSERSDPLIIDCGANVGLAVVYWKQRYPKARIQAFEPDPKVFRVLEWNCNQRNYNNVGLNNKAVWIHDGGVEFEVEGGDAGAIRDEAASSELLSVPTIRLRDLLDDPIDLLKLDIEGAETEVLIDCTGALTNVERLFVEYHSFAEEEQRLDALINVLQEAGFRLHLHPELVADRPFVERPYHAGMDHRLNIFAYRA